MDVFQLSFLKQAFIQSFLSLDVSILETYMKADVILGNKMKYHFLTELDKIFRLYQSKTNVFTVKRKDKICLGCSKGKYVVQFTIYCGGTEVDDYGFVIDSDGSILKDIYRCHYYKESQPIQIKPQGLPSITIRNFSYE